MAATLLHRPQRSPARRPAQLGSHDLRCAIALAVVAAGAVVAIALWWQDTPTVAGPGQWLTNAGRVTGLLAGYGLAVLLILMSRTPVLERGLGADTLARWHAAGGRYVVSLVVAHAVLITWGYAVAAHAGVIDETGTLLTSYPDVLMATVGGLLLVGVGMVSARWARSRVGYETWYYLHLYTYLAVGLAFSHQFATGADFATSLRARVLWSALYLVAAGSVVMHRIVAPVRAAMRHRLRVVDATRVSADTISIRVSGENLADLRAEAGHFFRWRFLTRDQWWQSHPYSLSAAPGVGQLRITVKALGDHSRALSRLRPGTRVLAEGPYGAMTAQRRRRRKVLLVAGGVGVTPLRALFETLPARPGELTMVVRANREDDVLLRDELDAIAERRGAHVHYLVGEPGSPADPFVERRLLRLVPDLAQRDVFLCGPPAFMAVAAARLRACGVPRRCLHQEQFAF